MRRRTSGLADVPDPGSAGDLGEVIGVFVVALVVIGLLVLVGSPFLIALGDLVLVLLLAVGGAVARQLFRRPWAVDGYQEAPIGIVLSGRCIVVRGRR